MQLENCRGGFQKKKIQTKPRKSQALTWGLRTNTLPSVFSGNLSKVYLILVANVRDFYAVVFGTLRGKLVEYPRLLIISPRSLNNFWNFRIPRCAKCKSPLHGPRNYVDRTCERSANYSALTFSCYRAKPKCNFAVCPLYDRSTMLGQLSQTVWVCFFGEETKTKYCLGIRKNVWDNGRSGTFGGL